MTYSFGSVILHDDYNIFATGNANGTANHGVANINTVWGVGTGNKGYGQTTLPILTAVNAGSDVVTATQWSTLLNRILSASNHQSTTITPITNPTAQQTISAYSALSTNVTSVFNNRLNCTSSGTDITSGGAGTYASSWNNTLTFTHTITFTSGDAARYFFNTGGRIALTYGLSGGSSLYNGVISTLLSNAGTIYVTADSSVTQTIAGGSYTGTTKSGGSGGSVTQVGYYQLTTSNQQIYSSSTTSYYGYETDAFTINIKSNGTQGSNSDKGSVITITSYLSTSVTTGSTRLGSTGGSVTPVDGTIAANCVLKPSEITYTTTASWGSPSMSVSASAT
jgi:hypothetical protein